MATISRWARIRNAAEDFFAERDIASEQRQGKFQRFAHFCLMVAKSFQKNRCPVRASALAYTTLLALIPLLAVAVTITTSMLQKRGQEPVRELIDRLVDYVAPALDLHQTAGAGSTAGAAPAQTGRQKVVEQITSFISNINTSTLGVTSVLALLFVGISLLRTIEATLNDIWGVTQGRNWVKSIVYYWAAITLGPLFLVGAIVLTSGPYMKRTQDMLNTVPGLSAVVFNVAPFVILSVGFAVFYALMPNTRVQWKAALTGGLVGGCLWQLNNLFSIVYVSRAVSYTSIYGSLGIFPLFLVGLYFSWLIMLLGAQVAYAYQNREAYIQEKQSEHVNQRGREFIALRVMTYIADRFMRGEKPANPVTISCALGAPSALVCKILTTFVHTGLLVEVVDGNETCYSPGRPLDKISAHDVLRALRAGQGVEPATKEDPWRTAVRAEFERILDAERQVGHSVTLEMLAQKQSEGAKAVA